VRNAILTIALAWATMPSMAAARTKSPDPRATCVWQRVPESASNWLSKFPLKKNQSHADGSAGTHLKMRIIAACYDVKSPKIPLYIANSSPVFLQNLLNASQFKTAALPDLEPTSAFYCTIFFEDDPEGKFPAGYDYGYGEDTQKSQIASARRGYGVNFGMTQASAALDRSRAEQAGRTVSIPNAPERVKAYHPAMKEGKSFVITEGAGIRTCKFISSDGTLTNA
jgi:hypothetical protein